MMTTTKKLKACPFCGGEMEITTGAMGFFFECSECKASWHGGILTNYATQNKRNLRKLINSAIEKWNNDVRKEKLTMKDNKFFNEMQKKLDAMTYGERYDNANANHGKISAYGAWRDGNKYKLDFPFLTLSLPEKDTSDFLKTIEAAGFKKFGFFSHTENAIENITEFLKAGWKLTRTFETDFGTFIANGLVLEK